MLSCSGLHVCRLNRISAIANGRIIIAPNANQSSKDFNKTTVFFCTPEPSTPEPRCKKLKQYKHETAGSCQLGFQFIDLGSGLNLLCSININAKFNFINQQANDNIVHFF